mmetsp:Transcript_8465/g.22623  ORF Transcript_8465/g.22623 Transcript_8465/m.22623 type:complete len:90 (+) Transcript_8465:2358-2627(+)
MNKEEQKNMTGVKKKSEIHMYQVSTSRYDKDEHCHLPMHARICMDTTTHAGSIQMQARCMHPPLAHSPHFYLHIRQVHYTPRRPCPLGR